MTRTAFQHRMAAHCESGTLTGLLNHAGLDISEAMVFGISAGIFFGYFKTPMLTFPTFVLRNKPGKMRTNLEKYLGITFRSATFRDPERAMAALDDLLEQGVPAAVQVDYFYMDYLPEYTRAHFNAHFVTVVGKEEGRYLISDSYFPQLGTVDAGTLRTARFTRGQFAPKGLLFYPESIPAGLDFAAAVRKGIRAASFYMLKVPIPFLGVRGIRYFARSIRHWPSYARDEEHLSHQVMMIHIILEERGTGGGGFRFLYAAFLQEAARVLNNPGLAGLAVEMMENGDRWREISLFVARIGRRRDLGTERLAELRDLLMARADAEQDLFTRLRAAVK